MATVLQMIKGSDKKFFLRVVMHETQEPYDLTGVSEIKVLFGKNTDPLTVLTKTLTEGAVVIVDAKIGKFEVNLTEIDTASLKSGEGLSFEVEIQKGQDTSIVQFLEVLNIYERVFATA